MSATMLFCQLLNLHFLHMFTCSLGNVCLKAACVFGWRRSTARAKLTTFPASATVFCIVVYCTVSLLPASFITFITHRVLVKIVSVPERGNILGVNNDRYHQSTAYPSRTNCNFSVLCSLFRTSFDIGIQFIVLQSSTIWISTNKLSSISM